MPSITHVVSLLSFLFPLCLSHAASSGELPRMEGIRSTACLQALEIAREAFRSSTADLRQILLPLPNANVDLMLALSLPGNGIDFVDKKWIGFVSDHDNRDKGIYYWKRLPGKVAPMIRKSFPGSGQSFDIRLVSLEGETANPAQLFDSYLDHFNTDFPPRIYMSDLDRSW